jgi:hypothetical protein
MATKRQPVKAKADKKAAVKKTCRKCKRWKEIKGNIRIAEVLENTVARFEKKLKEQNYTPTMAEYLKLVQMEKEWEEHEAKNSDTRREIKVTWVGTTPEPEQSNSEA